MNFDAQCLYELLPAIYRIRDAATGEPLKEFLTVFAEEIAVLEENLEQLYDDQFIETCADWVVPYIGDLIGYRPLQGVTARISSPRAEVAATIDLRRSKGTAVMLSRLAREVTGWPAHCVEFFQLLSTTQYLNHLRPHAQFTADLRSWETLADVQTAFDTLGHTIDVRRIATRAGRHNIPNIGIFVWRIASFGLIDSVPAALDQRRFFFNPLGINAPLFTRIQLDDQPPHNTGPLEVPDPIGRRMLDAYMDDYYHDDDVAKSIRITVNRQAIPTNQICACDLSDDINNGPWANTPHVPANNIVAIDPVLGRIAFPQTLILPPSAEFSAGQTFAAGLPLPDVRVSFHYGFGGEIGGGPYARGAQFASPTVGQTVLQVTNQGNPPPVGSYATIQAALQALPPAGGIVEVLDSGLYSETPSIAAAQNATIELRAADHQRPTLILGGELAITGCSNSSITLNGFLVSAGSTAPAMSGLLHVLPNAANTVPNTPTTPSALRLRHCTLVPGLVLNVDATPQRPATPGITVDGGEVDVTVECSILGAVGVPSGATFTAHDSIIDATASTAVAYAAPDHVGAGGTLSLSACTVIGKIHAEIIALVSNSILHAALAATGETWTAPVRATRRQEGCLRFSYVPLSAVVPTRFRCQPSFAIETEITRLEQAGNTKLDAAQRAAVRSQIEPRLVPAFGSLTYGRPDYAWLRESGPREIATGADDESEMGAFHYLFQPQREANLRVCLEEYLRFGLEVGIFSA